MFNFSGCDWIYNEIQSGSLATPVYDTKAMTPGQNMTCTWQISVYKDHKMAVSFDDSHLGNRKNYLEVRDGFNVKAPLLANYSGGYH